MAAAQAQYSPVTLTECANTIACIANDYPSMNAFLGAELYSPLLAYANLVEIDNERNFTTTTMNILPLDRVDCDALERKPEKVGGLERQVPLQKFTKSVFMTEMSERCCRTYVELGRMLTKFNRSIEAMYLGATYALNRVIMDAIEGNVIVTEMDACNNCTYKTVTAAEDNIKTVDATGGFTYDTFMEALGVLSANSFSQDSFFLLPFPAYAALQKNFLSTGNLSCECRDAGGTMMTLSGRPLFVPSVPSQYLKVTKNAPIGNTNKDVVYGYLIARGALSVAVSHSVWPTAPKYLDELPPAIKSMIIGMLGRPESYYPSGGYIPSGAMTDPRDMFDLTVSPNDPWKFKGLIASLDSHMGAMRTFPGGIVRIALPPTYLL